MASNGFTHFFQTQTSMNAAEEPTTVAVIPSVVIPLEVSSVNVYPGSREMKSCAQVYISYY